MSKTLKYNDYSLTYDEYQLGYESINGTVENEYDYSKDYLTFEALEDTVFTFTIEQDNYGATLDITSVSYSIDNGTTWITTSRVADSSTIITTPTIPTGNKVLWKGIASIYYQSTGPGIWSKFSSTGNFNVSGNITSLCYEDDFKNISTCNTYGGLWKGCNNLISAENLILPATTLIIRCYTQMFKNCSSLTVAPELPATTLATYCYDRMFADCPTLITAPELPATTLADSCYLNMFSGCTGLTKVPEELPAITLTPACYNNMFRDCESLTKAPVLPARQLAIQCYSYMFYNCTNLKYIKAMFRSIPTTSGYSPGYTNSWVAKVSPTGTFVKNSTAEWDMTGSDGIPSGWTVIESNE